MSTGRKMKIVPVETQQGVFLEVTLGGDSARLGPLHAGKEVLLHVEDEENPWEKPRKTSKAMVQKKRSMAREKAVAGDLGARVQPGSGALPTKKGDAVKKGVLRIEHKYTDASSYRLTLDTLTKIEGEADHGEVPIVVVEFLDPKVKRPLESYAILALSNLEKFVNAHPDAERPGSRKRR